MNTTKNTPSVFHPGDFIQCMLVSDTCVFEVVKTTPHTITIRSTKTLDGNLNENKDDWVVFRPVDSDPQGRVQTLRRRKDGKFRLPGMRGSMSPARTISGIPVSRVDYSF